MSEYPFVSVLIVTKNRAFMLQRTLDALFRSDYPNFEVVLVDNESTDGTQTIATEYRLRYFVAGGGFARVRQHGVEKCQGEFILMLDDDCIVEPDWMKVIVRRFLSDLQIGIIGGHIINVGFEGEDRFKGRGIIGPNGRYVVEPDLSRVEVFGSANMAIRKCAIDEVGGYDPFFYDGMEEADLTLRIKATGYKVVYERGAKLYHLKSVSSASRWPRDEARMRLYFFFKHYRPDTMRAWYDFWRTELRLYWRESILGLVTGFIRRLRRSVKEDTETPDQLPTEPALDVVFMRHWQYLLARLAIPLLFRRAQARRQYEQIGSRTREMESDRSVSPVSPERQVQ